MVGPKIRPSNGFSDTSPVYGSKSSTDLQHVSIAVYYWLS